MDDSDSFLDSGIGSFFGPDEPVSRRKQPKDKEAKLKKKKDKRKDLAQNFEDTQNISSDENVSI